MLTDRTYLLFKPRNNSERLDIRSNNLSSKFDFQTYPKSSNNSYYGPRLNNLSHSSSYDRLSTNQYTGTPILGRKFGNTTSDYSNNFSTYSRRRTATFSYNDHHPLQRSDSSSSIRLFTEKSSNMEKREMLMSSFNRHTSANNDNWLKNSKLNRLKLNTLINTNQSILPPRPKHSSFYYNKQSFNNPVSYYKSNFYHTNYNNYDDYFRPKIRDRPLFSDIRKSVMHKSSRQTKFNQKSYDYYNDYPNRFTILNSSVKSNSSNFSDETNDENFREKKNSDESSLNTPVTCSPLQSQKSVRKVDRYRSIIKFREHNIGKTYEDRKKLINWDIDLNDEAIFSTNTDKNSELDNIESFNEIKENFNKKLDDNYYSVITDTTILNNSSSSNSSSDLNVGLDLDTDENPTNLILEQQFAAIEKKNQDLYELKQVLKEKESLIKGKKKLHKSISLDTSGKELKLNKKSKSVKINLDNLEIINNKTTEKTDEIETKKKMTTMKKILKTATKPFTKKTNKIKIKENEKDLNNNCLTTDLNKNEKIEDNLKLVEITDKKDLKNSENLKKKTLIELKNEDNSKDTITSKNENNFVTKIDQNLLKTDYIKLNEHKKDNLNLLKNKSNGTLEYKVCLKTDSLKTDYFYYEYLITTTKSSLIKTEYTKPEIFETKLSSNLIKTKYLYPEIFYSKIDQPLIKTEFFKAPIINQLILLKSDLIKTDFIQFPISEVKLKTPLIKTDFHKIELFETKCKSELLNTGYQYYKYKTVLSTSPLIKTDYSKIEWFVTKSIYSDLVNCSFIVNLPIYSVSLNSDLVKTDYYKFILKSFTTIKKLSNTKTKYFKYSIKVTNLTTQLIKTEYISLPEIIYEVNLNINYFDTIDYVFYEQDLSNLAKPPIILTIKKSNNKSKTNLNKLEVFDEIKNKSSCSLSLDSYTSSLKSSLKSSISSLKSNTSFSNENNDDGVEKKKTKPKIKKVKKVKKVSKLDIKDNEELKENEEKSISLKNNSQDLKNLARNLTADNFDKLKSKPNLRSLSLDYENIESNTFQSNIKKEDFEYSDQIIKNENEISANDFNFIKVLGRGSFGKVLLAERKDTDELYAIKCLKKNVVIEDNDIESAISEKKVLVSGSINPFIVNLFCTFQTESHLCFVIEWLAGGDLMYHVQKQGRFTEEHTRFYAAEIVCALKFLHRRYIIYRDLKLDNILLDKNGHIRLVDFGMSIITYRLDCLPSNFAGTPDYMAPEIIKGVKYNHSVDWWSFGVLAYEMLCGKSPFTGADEDELLWNVCNEKIVFPLFLSKESVHLIALLLNRNSEKRLGMPGCPVGDITEQPFFMGIDWELADSKKLKPPFVPDLKGENDTSNFDAEFTEAEPVLTPIDKSIICELDQNLFDGFDYTCSGLMK